MILVGITINSLTEDGLFGKTKTTKEKTEYSSAKEIIDLKISEVAIEYQGKYGINEIKKSIESEAEKSITLEKYYFEDQAKLASGLQIPEENLVVKGIVVSANKYPKYKFLIGKGGKIQGATTINISDTTKIEEFIDIEEFEPNKVQTDLTLPTILKTNIKILDKTTIKIAITLRNEQNVNISYSIRKKGENEYLEVVENTTQLYNVFENLETLEDYTITIIAENEKGKSEKTVDISLEAIQVPEEVRIYVGTVKKIEAEVYTEAGDYKWSSGNSNIVTVDQKGNATAVSCGETIITLKSGGIFKDIKVKVVNDILQLIETGEDISNLGMSLVTSGCNSAYCDREHGFTISAKGKKLSPSAVLYVPGEYLTGKEIHATYDVAGTAGGWWIAQILCKVTVNYADGDKDETDPAGVSQNGSASGELVIELKDKPVTGVEFSIWGYDEDFFGVRGGFYSIKM